jgi:hypothetical protein
MKYPEYKLLTSARFINFTGKILKIHFENITWVFQLNSAPELSKGKGKVVPVLN